MLTEKGLATVRKQANDLAESINCVILKPFFGRKAVPRKREQMIKFRTLVRELIRLFRDLDEKLTQLIDNAEDDTDMDRCDDEGRVDPYDIITQRHPSSLS